MSETVTEEWESLAGLDPETAQFPARAKLGEEGILIFRTEKGFFAVERTCPHQQASMAQAVLQGGGTMIRCPQHNFTFRTSNGLPVNCPGFKLRVWPVKRDGAQLLIRRAPAS